jgi:hypothetical protein
MLDSDKHHQRYEATVKAWNDLRTILNALSPDEERVAWSINSAFNQLSIGMPLTQDEALKLARAAIQSIVGERDD